MSGPPPHRRLNTLVLTWISTFPALNHFYKADVRIIRMELLVMLVSGLWPTSKLIFNELQECRFKSIQKTIVKYMMTVAGYKTRGAANIPVRNLLSLVNIPYRL